MRRQKHFSWCQKQTAMCLHSLCIKLYLFNRPVLSYVFSHLDNIWYMVHGTMQKTIKTYIYIYLMIHLFFFLYPRSRWAWTLSGANGYRTKSVHFQKQVTRRCWLLRPLLPPELTIIMAFNGQHDATFLFKQEVGFSLSV